MKKRSYSGLQADLRCANQEAQNYLTSNHRCHEEIEALKKEVASLKECEQTNSILCQIIQRLLK